MFPVDAHSKMKTYAHWFISGLLASLIAITAASADQPAEFTVFGTGERIQLNNEAASPLVKLDRLSVASETFNYRVGQTYAVSLIHSGELVIEQGHPNGLYEAYNNRLDNKTMEIMAETLVIRSPWRLKGTDVSIYARELRFEGTGQINTQPEEKATNAADATGEGTGNKGSNGAEGLPGGSIDLSVGALVNNSSATAIFYLKGGKGQGAGKGKHGTKGADAARAFSSFTGTYTCSTTGSDTETAYPPAGYLITFVRKVGGSTWCPSSGACFTTDWPGHGENAWQSGTPGRGGDGGSFDLVYGGLSGQNISVNPFGGAAGAAGIATANSTSSSQTQVVGGAHGFPEKSWHAKAVEQGGVFDCDLEFNEENRRTAVNGQTFPVPTNVAGSQGAVNTAQTSYGWLNPQLLRQVLAGVKDDYLQNRIDEADLVLQDYSQQIEGFRADTSAWNAAAQMTRYELGQMYDEMQLLRQQIANSQDYFGNPNGWVPMLSFEVAMAAFDQEIDRSLDMVYLAKWITAKQENAALTVAALATARAMLAAEIDTAKTDYDAAVTVLDNLTLESDVINQRVAALQVELQSKDATLREQAEENVAPSDWEVALRTGLKVAGTICEMVPVYQPALGAAGGALNLASNYDPDEPWSTVTGVFELSQAYATSGIQQAADDQQAQKNGVTTSALSGSAARLQNLQNLSTGALALSNGIQSINSTLEQSKAPASEIDAELARLRRTNPEYKALIADITQLLQDKVEFANKMSTAIRDIAGISDLITRNILAIDALDVTTGPLRNVIDSRVNAYLQDMERRAFDRLLKYHYYMAKAYEYRLVQPYNGTLDLQGLFNSINTIVTAGSTPGGVLGSGERDLIKSVYQAVIADTAETILTDYNNSPSTPGTSRVVALNAAQLDTLNRGDVLDLNLFEMGIFLPTEEDVRITNIKLLDPNGVSASYSPGSSQGFISFVELVLQHSGLSNLENDGDVFQFRHYNQSTRTAITWYDSYDLISQSFLPTPLQAASNSLLQALIPSLSTPNQLLYSRPSAWADLRVWRRGVNGLSQFDLGTANPPILLDEVLLLVSFDRKERSENVRKLGLVARTEAGDALAPEFTVSEADRNGRQNGTGDIVRIFNTNPASVQVTAETAYGAYGFLKWRLGGVDYGPTPENPVATVFKNIDSRLEAVYELLPPEIISAVDDIILDAAPFDLDYQIVGSNGATSFNAIGLPLGVSVDTVTGLISGTVTTPGVYTVQLSASNEGGTGSATLNIYAGSIVSSTADSGPGSLRQRVLDSTVGDTITFVAGLDGATITLAGSQLLIDKDLTIDASGLANGLTISGNDSSRVFEINAGSSVEMRGFTIADGDSTEAGGILVEDASLSLVDMTVSNNHANASGGGIKNVRGVVTLTRTTLSGNSADINGGGIFSGGGGTSTEVVTIINSTVSGNSSNTGGGIYNFFGTLSVMHSTVSGNQATTQGGGIQNSAAITATIENSIVAGNTDSGIGPDISNGGPITVVGANLIGNNQSVTSQFPAGPLTGTSANPLDPLLAPLGDNGGPTHTMLPLPGSLAVDAALATPNSPATDQRGVLRPFGPGSDLGSVEVDITYLPNDSFTSATPIGPAGGTFQGTLLGATVDGSTGGAGANEPDVWYVYMAPAAGTLRVNTCGSNGLTGLDTVLSVHTETGVVGNAANQVGLNDDWQGTGGDLDAQCPNSLESAVSLAVDDGDALLIRVSRYSSGTDGDFILNVALEILDADGDGITDAQELLDGTNPNSVDTDGDGLVDGAGGIVTVASYPAGIDGNGDGFVDGEADYGTDPNASNVGDVAPQGSPDNLVNVGDLLLLTQMVNGVIQPTVVDIALGDIDGDGDLDIADLLVMQQNLLNGGAP